MTTLPGTAVCGQVFASEIGDGGVNVILAGVTITVDGMETELFAVTDSKGNIRGNSFPGQDYVTATWRKSGPFEVTYHGPLRSHVTTDL